MRFSNKHCSLIYFSLCYFTSESTMYKQRFMSQLKATFGSGGISCSFSDSQISPDESRYVWLDQSQLDDKYSKCKVPKEDICTQIEELASREGDLLSNVLTVLRTCLGITSTRGEGSGDSCTVFVCSRGICIEPMGCEVSHDLPHARMFGMPQIMRVLFCSTSTAMESEIKSALDKSGARNGIYVSSPEAKGRCRWIPPRKRRLRIPSNRERQQLVLRNPPFDILRGKSSKKRCYC